MPFETRKLKAWADIHDYLQRPGLFRGQSNADWPLATSFDRCCERESVQKDDRARFEKALNREFRRAYHHYDGHVPSSNAKIEWLSLMQHYGAPTRLLDFTYSIYVAAHFAVEDALVLQLEK